MGVGSGSSGNVPPASSLGPHGRGAASLRGSNSVPAVLKYLKVDPGGFPDGASDGPNSPLQPVREGFPSRMPQYSKLRNGGVYAVSGISQPSSHWWDCWKAVTGLLFLATTLLYLGFLLGKFYRKSEALQYAVVIDGGSTGTRVHVYAWAHSPNNSLPVMVKPTYSRDDSAPWYRVPGQQRAYKRVETEPGLDKTLNNKTAVQNALQPLLNWAEKQIPPYARQSTRLFLLATAGLRSLPLTHSKSILDNAYLVLRNSSFLCKRNWVKVISGAHEAYYGWIALNYNLGRLGHTSELPTVGTLDLGGSSLQVTFETRDPAQKYGVNVSVGATDHHLYAISHAGFGLNDAFEKSVLQLLRPQASWSNGVVVTTNGVVEVRHPCLQRGYKKPFVCSTHCMLPPLAFASQSDNLGDRSAQVELIGSSNWKACQALVKKVVNSSFTERCSSPSCALGKYQSSPEGKFYGLAGFFVVYKFFGLKGDAPLGKLVKKGQKFCELNWKDAQAKVVAQPSVDQYCFRAPYVAALLRQGLHLHDDQVTIGPGDFAWTLGAALWEAGALVPAHGEAGKTALETFINIRIAASISLLLLLFLILGVVLCYLRPRHGLYLPRFIFLSSKPDGPHWLQLSLKAPGRLTSLTTNGLKLGMAVYAPDRHQKMTGKMQHKGGFLQSRRMQPREDSISDLHGV